MKSGVIAAESIFDLLTKSTDENKAGGIKRKRVLEKIKLFLKKNHS